MNNYFKSKVKDTFKFLVDVHGFSGPHDFNGDKGFLEIYYCHKSVCVELSYDIQEGDVACNVSKSLNGGRPGGYNYSDNGDRIRIDVYDYIRKAGVNKRLFTNISKYNSAQRIDVTLEDYKAMLIEHMPGVLRGVFPEVV